MTSDSLLTPALVAIHERRSVRSYADTPIEHESIDRLLDAAVWAPSALNTQPWSFVVVQDLALIAQFEGRTAELFLQDPPSGALAALPTDELELLRSLVLEPGFTIFHGAPALIVIYATNGDVVSDCYLAAENLMLAATVLGLGSCPIGMARPFFDEPTVKAELGVPAAYRCALPIVVGESDGDASPTSRRAPEILIWR